MIKENEEREEAYIESWEIYKSLKNEFEMKEISQKIVTLCDKTHIPTSVWVRAQMIHAESLAAND